MEDQCCAHILVIIRFAIFLLHLSKVLRQPRKQAARSSELLHIMQNHLSNPTLMMLQNERNQRPDFPTSLIIFPQTYLLLFANHAPNIRARITRNLNKPQTQQASYYLFRISKTEIKENIVNPDKVLVT